MEIWKEITGYEGIYEVSNCGNVRRIHKDKRSSNYKVLKQDNLRGYRKVHLYKDGKGKPFQVHRLVAEAFISNPNNLPQVNHKDENTSNNHVENLEWCTLKYNVNYGTGTQRQSISRGKVVLCYNLNMNLLGEYPSTSEASRALSVDQCSIVRCCKGGYWKNNRTKFINVTRVKNYIFKYKDETN